MREKKRSRSTVCVERRRVGHVASRAADCHVHLLHRGGFDPSVRTNVCERNTVGDERV